MTRHPDQEQEVMQVGEDDICQDGAYLNELHTCLPCPVGCAHCHSMGHCYDCVGNFEAVYGPNFGFCFPKCFHGHYRKTVYDDDVKFLEYLNEIDPSLSYTAEMEMKVLIPPQLMMKTCQKCPENCRGCFAAQDGTPFCYECMHAYIIDKSTDTCVVDPTWESSSSVISVKANRRSIAQCDEVKLRMYAEEGYDVSEGLVDVTWKIEVLNMTLRQEVRDGVAQMQEQYEGQDSFIVNNTFTAMLPVGAQLKVTGYANSKEGSIISDEETVAISYGPHP